jgi:hypothetical protein
MWYLATNENDVFHYGELSEESIVTTGQPKLVYFETKEDLVLELANYGQEYIDPTILEPMEPILPELPSE